MKNDNMQTKQGIGLFKINYRMDVGAGDTVNNDWQAGIIAYSSEEAVKTLAEFCKTKVKGFRGMHIDQVAFDGYCHSIADSVREKIIQGAVADGVVEYPKKKKIAAETTEMVDEVTKKPKKSIINK